MSNNPADVPPDPASPSVTMARLVVFTRFPEPGKTKTRLIERLGAAGAAELQRQMTVHTLAMARELRSRRGIGVEVRFAGGGAVSMRACFGDDLPYRDQGQGSLGERMARSIRESICEGAAPAVIIGSDCPGVTAGLLGRAFDLLHADPSLIVVGPARDGGYYLIGMGREAPELFRGIDWGAEDVLSRTVATARRSGRPLGMLEELEDVDRPEDLDVWYALRGRAADRSAGRTDDGSGTRP